jgi:hypothetical protein
MEYPEFKKKSYLTLPSPNVGTKIPYVSLDLIGCFFYKFLYNIFINISARLMKKEKSTYIDGRIVHCSRVDAALLLEG